MLRIIIWLCCGFACKHLAEEKNKAGGYAFVMGMLFGLFAVLYYALCKKQ